jgi:hypothetical protein
MAYIFSNQNPSLGKFCTVLQWKVFAYFMDIWSILQPFDIFYDHMAHFVVIWYIFPFLYVVARKIWQPWSEYVPITNCHLDFCGFNSMTATLTVTVTDRSVVLNIQTRVARFLWYIIPKFGKIYQMTLKYIKWCRAMCPIAVKYSKWT